MHPGQYTVLSSEQPLVVSRAIAELDYQARVLTSLALDRSHKIVLHVGSGAADPAAAATRFAAGLARLSDDARARLVVEHDERWTLERVLELAAPLALPVVFDARSRGAPARHGGRGTGARRFTSRRRNPASDRAHTPGRSTSLPSRASRTRSATCRSTASSR